MDSKRKVSFDLNFVLTTKFWSKLIK